MDSLIAKADAIQPFNKKRKTSHPSDSYKHSSKASSRSKSKGDTSTDYTLHSISSHTALPKSLSVNPSSDLQTQVPTYNHIANKKLRTSLNRQSVHNTLSSSLADSANDLLASEEAGGIQVDGALEKTWRIGQVEIEKSVGGEAGKGRREVKLDDGIARMRWSRNGRHMAMVGRRGRIATVDWMTGQMQAELNVGELCRDITFLHDNTYFAVAQKKYVFIYDRDGVELHCIKSHVEPTRIEFLPYHWLLASIGMTGYLKYTDTSTGALVVQHRTKLGSCTSLTQNPHTAVLYLGHQNGCVTLWTPNLPKPAVQLLAHVGPVSSVGVDGSSMGRYMATAGRDGKVKVWDCRNWKGVVREWTVRGSGETEVEWSQRGYLGVCTGGSVNVYQPPAVHTTFNGNSPPPLYITHPIPHRPLTCTKFSPFNDILAVGHNSGLTSILVPGSGEPNFDSFEADPFENKQARREREVRALLDKIQPDMISLDPEFVGTLAPPSKLTTSAALALEVKGGGKGTVKGEVPFARLPRIERLRVSGKLDVTEDKSESEEEDDEEVPDGETPEEKEARLQRKEVQKKAHKEEREKRKMRGKGKSMKRYLRKQRKNVVDPTVLAIRAKVEKQKEDKKKARDAVLKGNDDGEPKKKSALDRFKRST